MKYLKNLELYDICLVYECLYLSMIKIWPCSEKRHGFIGYVQKTSEDACEKIFDNR